MKSSVKLITNMFDRDRNIDAQVYMYKMNPRHQLHFAAVQQRRIKKSYAVQFEYQWKKNTMTNAHEFCVGFNCYKCRFSFFECHLNSFHNVQYKISM